jgi:hypothetical protein
MGFGTRTPTPNEPERGGWVYGPREPHDDFSALLNGIAARCRGCKRVTMRRYLHEGKCPPCLTREPSTDAGEVS